MPVTVTAKRALRGSAKKAIVNSLIISKLEMAIRQAKKIKSAKAVITAISLTDRAAKKKVIKKNKAARIKSSLSKLSKPAKSTPKPKAKKTSKKK